MNKNMLYTKQEGDRDLLSQHQEPPCSDSETVEREQILPDMELMPSYTKAEGTLSYDIVCVISGGTTRERDFLMYLERKPMFKRLNVVFISTPKSQGGLTPTMMQTRFYAMANQGYIEQRGRKIQFDEVDSVYMLSDVDHYENDLKMILAEADYKGLVVKPIWIISNPSFEIWIYYCFRNNPEQDLQAIPLALPKDRSSLLKNINGTFNNGGGLDPRKAFEHIAEGIAHSKEHYSEESGFPSLLSTQMHSFAEDILNRLQGEYDEWLRNKREQLLAFKQNC